MIDSFRDVQAAEQTRDTLEKQADAYANQVIAAARGEAAQLLEEAEGYRARVVNEAEGEAQRFIAVYDEYAKAEDVTRKRLYLETMERVLGDVDKIIIDDGAQRVGRGALPAAQRGAARRSGTAAATTTSGRAELMRRTQILIGVAVVAVVVIALNAFYIVDEREKALRLWFGEVTAEITEPGLYFKVPVLHEIAKYDDRILPLDTQPLEVTPADDRRLVVDAFARWRIADATQFRRAVGASGIEGARQRLERILNAQLREVLGGVDSGAVLSADRVALMNQIRDQARTEADGARGPGDRRADQARRPARAEPRRPPSSGCAPSVNARRRTRSPAVRKRRSGCAPRPTGPWSRPPPRRRSRPRSSAVRPTPSATGSSPTPSGATRSSSPSTARSRPTRTACRARTRRW